MPSVANYMDGSVLILVGLLLCYMIFSGFINALKKSKANHAKEIVTFAAAMALLIWVLNYLAMANVEYAAGDYNSGYAWLAYGYAMLLTSLNGHIVLKSKAALYKWLHVGFLMVACFAATFTIQLAGYEKAAALNYDLTLIVLSILMAAVIIFLGLLIGLRIFLAQGKITPIAILIFAMTCVLAMFIFPLMSDYVFSPAIAHYETQESDDLTKIQLLVFYLSAIPMVVAVFFYLIFNKLKVDAGSNLEAIYTDILMMTCVVMAVALIIFSQWFNKKTHQEEVALLHIEQQIDHRVTRAHLWLEELRSGSAAIEWDEDIINNLLLARKYTKAALTGETVDDIFSYRARDSDLIEVFTSLDHNIGKWQELVARHKQKDGSWAYIFSTQLENHIFSTLDDNLGLLNTITKRMMKEEWQKVGLVNKVTLGCMTLLLLGIYRVYRRNKMKMYKTTVNLKAALKEVDVQKLALDEHAILSVTDHKGNIIYSNKKFAEISQYTPEELLDKGYRILNSHYHSREFFSDMWLTINDGKIWRGRIRNRRKDGAAYWVDTTIVPFVDDDSKPWQFISICNDITLVKEAEESLRNLNQELERRVLQRTAELAEINRAVEADREALQLMVEGTSTATGKNFFNLLVRYLATVLKVEYVIVAEQLYDMPLKSRTVAVRFKNTYAENFEYMLQGTPCEEVMINRCAIYARELNDSYKDIPILGDVKIESYMGVPMSDSRGRILGHIAVFDSKDFVDKHRLKFIMRIFATRAASELERQHVEEQLKKARDHAVSASRSKSEFLANMSHELRTPMHAILSFASMGKDEIDEGERDELKHYFLRIRQSAERLMSLLNDLLDLSKLNAGKMLFEFAQANLFEHVKSILNEYEAMAAAQNIMLEIEEPDFDATLLFDKDRMAQVVRNLITNAIKFSPKGKRIVVKFERAQLTNPVGNVDAIAMAVIDQGVGVPEEEHLLIFEQFQQSSRTNRHAGGTGLGLAICKEIVAAHQGEINITDNPEGGAILLVTLPVRITKEN